MDLFSWRYWLNISCVIFTMYIVIFYTMTPTKNECQMTFMMEPPKFIPIPIEACHETLNDATKKDHQHGCSVKSSYRLFMYSELGFTSQTNQHQDLKDSLPVLFVPGNAGSYQQVRSIASTCIRHQLQHLDAYKFIFYTIDFDNELSGFNGRLIADQTKFVHFAVKQILKLHPPEVEQVLLIGHSVGGFISKLLFTEPGFQQESVPLIISLASPLTRPYLTFDDEMHRLYELADSFWSSEKLNNQTIAISVSGGRSDRLVPMQLSLDPMYDLSLTTSCIQDVWLPADHVGITWCRELTQKFSKLLSKMMDRKRIGLISGKEQALTIAKEELLATNKLGEPTHHQLVWKTRRSVQTVPLLDFASLSRSEMLNSIIIVNVSIVDNILISIDHIDRVKLGGIFGCGIVELESDPIQTTCRHKTDFMNLGYRLPTKRFDIRKTLIRLQDNQKNEINYVVLDFHQDHNHNEKSKGTVPEQVTIQPMRKQDSLILEIPSLIWLLISKIWPFSSQEQEILSSLGVPTEIVTFVFDKHWIDTRHLIIKFKSSDCITGDLPIGPFISLYKNNYFAESFIPEVIDATSSTTDVVINSYDAFSFRTENKSSNEHSFNLYTDGRCRTKFKIQLSLTQTIYNLIKNRLEELFICLVFVSCASLRTSTNLLSTSSTESESGILVNLVTKISVYLIVNTGLEKVSNIEVTGLDSLAHLILIYFVCSSLHSTLVFLVRRVTDISSIFNEIHHKIRKQINYLHPARNSECVTVSSTTSGSIVYKLLHIIAVLIGSMVISPGTIVTLINLVKVIYCALTLRNSANDFISKNNNRHVKGSNDIQEISKTVYLLENMTEKLAVLMTINLLTDLPKAVIRVRNFGDLRPLDNMGEMLTFITVITMLVLLERLIVNIQTFLNQEKQEEKTRNGIACDQELLVDQSSLLFIFRESSIYVVGLLTIVLLKTNICQMHYVTMAVVLFVKTRTSQLLHQKKKAV